MTKIIIHTAFILLIISPAWRCSDGDNPVVSKGNGAGFSGNLFITTEKSEYRLEDISPENMVVITARLTNISPDTFYAKLGDGFNAGIDQDHLTVAQGTDGYFEKNIEGDRWENLNLSLLFEGSRVVRILPLKEYALSAVAFRDSTVEGRFRLRIQYYRNYSHGAADTLQDASNTFFILR